MHRVVVAVVGAVASAHAANGDRTVTEDNMNGEVRARLSVRTPDVSPAVSPLGLSLCPPCAQYLLAPTPNGTTTKWSTNFKDYPGGVESFDFYAGPVTRLVTASSSIMSTLPLP